jgi:hypothetical protein
MKPDENNRYRNRVDSTFRKIRDLSNVSVHGQLTIQREWNCYSDLLVPQDHEQERS